jgi:hypothetical protein
MAISQAADSIGATFIGIRQQGIFCMVGREAAPSLGDTDSLSTAKRAGGKRCPSLALELL